MNPHRRQILREELLRSIAWIGLGIVGWPIVIGEFAWLDPTALTILGLPVATWAVLTAGAIGVRTLTSATLQVRTPEGVQISLILGNMLGGIGAVYLATAGGYPVLWVIGGYVAMTGIAILWYWFARFPTAVSEMAS